MKIGICVREKDNTSKYEEFSEHIGIPKNIIRIVTEFNVIPIFLTMSCGIEELINETDGLIVPGSSRSIHDLTEYPIDKYIINKFILEEKPIFGICGGMQELCLQLNGTLKEKALSDHMNTIHKIKLYGEFKNIFKKDSILVNSFHENYCEIDCNDIAIFDNDTTKIKEGFIRKQNIGVQWHPEAMEYTHYKKIFQYFFNLCNDITKQ